MMYQEFVTRALEEMQTRYPEVDVQLYQKLCRNNVSRIGLQFGVAGGNISLIVYLEEFYDQLENGEQIYNVMDKISNSYINGSNTDIKIEEFCDYERVKENIVFTLIGKENNKSFLKDKPYVSYLDLAIIFQVQVKQFSPSIATFKITEELLADWNVTKEELYAQAKENTPRLNPYDFVNMFDMISELLGKEPEENAEETEESMYILTNMARNEGACAILYPGCLEYVGNRLKENFYILPSSIHECIIVPESEALPKGELELMVKDINQTQISNEEVLTDTVYYYDISKKHLV